MNIFTPPPVSAALTFVDVHTSLLFRLGNLIFPVTNKRMKMSVGRIIVDERKKEKMNDFLKRKEQENQCKFLSVGGK